MKVIHIIGNMGSGGAEKLLLETLPLYNSKGIQCDLIVFNGTEYPFMKKLKEYNCCTIYSLGFWSIYNPFLIFKIIPFLKKYDIAHVHLFPAQYWVVLAKIVSFSKIKLVLTEHNSINKRMTTIFLNKIDKYFYSYYNKLVCITNEIREILIKYTNQSENKFVIINNGIDLNEIYNAKAYPKEEIHKTIKKDDFLLIQVSRFNKQKDQLTVIKSLLHLPESVKLILVGDGELKQEHENKVKELKLEKRVIFLGLRSDVSRLIKSVDIVILSSFFEGLSLSSIEGMASGKPFIGSNVIGLSNVIDNAGILFKSQNDEELSSLILKLKNNSNYSDEIVRKCIEKAKKYDINIMIDKHIQLYNSLIPNN